ncbi:MAG: sugar ABC transporter permease [Firmicutes bacterium]|nr:sugar ABC transporter permease [Bacillota bacterium]
MQNNAGVKRREAFHPSPFKAALDKARPYLYLAPAALILFTFHLFPIVYGGFISLHQWGLKPGKMVGLQNYKLILADAEWWDSLLNTFYYVLTTVPLELGLGMLFAVLLFGKIKGRNLYRLSYFAPYITPLAAIGVVWGWVFNYNTGIINGVIRMLGGSAPRWLLEPTGILTLLGRFLGVKIPFGLEGPSLALVTISIVTVWHYVGFHTVIYLGGLTQIPKELFEAAKIDGANSFRVFRHIILPILSPTTLFLSVVGTIGAFQSITLIYVMTGMGWGGAGASGHPLGTTRVALLYIFEYFFTYTQTGYAMAGAILLFFIILFLSLLQMKVAGRRVFYLGEGD